MKHLRVKQTKTGNFRKESMVPLPKRFSILPNEKRWKHAALHIARSASEAGQAYSLIGNALRGVLVQGVHGGQEGEDDSVALVMPQTEEHHLRFDWPRNHGWYHLIGQTDPRNNCIQGRPQYAHSLCILLFTKHTRPIRQPFSVKV